MVWSPVWFVKRIQLHRVNWSNLGSDCSNRNVPSYSSAYLSARQCSFDANMQNGYNVSQSACNNCDLAGILSQITETNGVCSRILLPKYEVTSLFPPVAASRPNTPPMPCCPLNRGDESADEYSSRNVLPWYVTEDVDEIGVPSRGSFWFREKDEVPVIGFQLAMAKLGPSAHNITLTLMNCILNRFTRNSLKSHN